MKNNLSKIFEKNIRIPLLIIFIGILIRLLFMPFSAYIDLISATWRSYLFVFNGVFKLDDISEILLSPNMFLFKPVFAHLKVIVDSAIQAGESNIFTNSTATYGMFVSSPGAFRYLFFMKLPYLLFDLASVIVIVNFFKDLAKRNRMLLFWALNPMLIYSAYIWGRYEVVGILFVLLSLLFIKRRQNLLSVFFFSLAIIARTGYIVVLPFYIIYLSNNWRDYLKYSFVAILPLLLFNNLVGLIVGNSVVNNLGQGGLLDFALSAQVGIGYSAVALNMLVCPALYYIYFKSKRENDFLQFVSFLTMTILAFLLLSKLHAHYLVWITPFFTILLAYQRKLIIPYLAMIFSYFIFIDVYFGSTVSAGLFRAIDLNFFSNFAGISQQGSMTIYDHNLLVTLFHSIYFLCGSTLFYFIYRESSKNES